MARTFVKLLLAYNQHLAPDIDEVTPPQGASRAWRMTSRRGWHELKNKSYTATGPRSARQLPALLEADGGLFILEAVGKLLASDAFYTTTTETRTIGRKKYVRLNAKLIDAILFQPTYFSDGFFRVTSTATTGDGIDIGLFLRQLDGRPTTLLAVIEEAQ